MSEPWWVLAERAREAWESVTAVEREELLLEMRSDDAECAHEWEDGAAPGDEWRECFLCGKQDRPVPPLADLTDFLLTRIAEDEDRALAECRAKRLILASLHMGSGTTLEAREAWRVAERDVLRLLARPYRDHPDYREDWR
jgi:hypothetical protein